MRAWATFLGEGAGRNWECEGRGERTPPKGGYQDRGGEGADRGTGCEVERDSKRTTARLVAAVRGIEPRQRDPREGERREAPPRMPGLDEIRRAADGCAGEDV